MDYHVYFRNFLHKRIITLRMLHIWTLFWDPTREGTFFIHIFIRHTPLRTATVALTCYGGAGTFCWCSSYDSCPLTLTMMCGGDLPPHGRFVDTCSRNSGVLFLFRWNSMSPTAGVFGVRLPSPHTGGIYISSSCFGLWRRCHPRCPDYLWHHFRGTWLL
jgi:hypothetical protein